MYVHGCVHGCIPVCVSEMDISCHPLLFTTWVFLCACAHVCLCTWVCTCVHGHVHAWDSLAHACTEAEVDAVPSSIASPFHFLSQCLSGNWSSLLLPDQLSSERWGLPVSRAP